MRRRGEKKKNGEKKTVKSRETTSFGIASLRKDIMMSERTVQMHAYSETSS